MGQRGVGSGPRYIYSSVKAHTTPHHTPAAEDRRGPDVHTQHTLLLLLQKFSCVLLMQCVLQPEKQHVVPSYRGPRANKSPSGPSNNCCCLFSSLGPIYLPRTGSGVLSRRIIAYLEQHSSPLLTSRVQSNPARWGLGAFPCGGRPWVRGEGGRWTERCGR